MTPDERKAAIRKELIRRELERRKGGGTPPEAASPTVKNMLSGMDAPVDDGTTPVPVAEDLPGWDWGRKNFPGLFDVGHELGAGFVGGASQLPNAVPNTANALKGLYDLHFGSGKGVVAPEDQWGEWMGEKGFVASPFRSDEEAYPPTPGVDPEWRRTGRVSGAAAPFGLASAVAAPLLYQGGKRVGQLADMFVGNQDRKWERTGETLMPLGAGVVRTGAGALARSGVKVPDMGIGSFAILNQIDPALPALVAGAKTAGRIASIGGRGSVVRDLGGTLAQSVAPLAIDDPRWAR
jgi:hypothetical protein